MDPGQFGTAEARWAGVGPYYAMFPAGFADRVVDKFTNRNDTIIDPFAGRGTSLYSAATKGRHALGIEINPVGWIYAATKLKPGRRSTVVGRIEELGSLMGRFRGAVKTMPLFYKRCFDPDVLSFLLAARSHLSWRDSIVDRTVMALVLIDLHGKYGTALSNQMRQTKSVAPDYAIRWWAENDFLPPKINPVEFMLKKIKWRYAHGLPCTSESRVYLADSTHRLSGLRSMVDRLAPKGANLLFTSPPYFGITNYHYDQWLRLWLLGGPATPRSMGSKHRGKFENSVNYRALLLSAFTRAGERLARNGIVYVRTDRRKATSKVTREVLQEVFPRHRILRRLRPLKGVTQTRLFGHATPKEGEIDLILWRK